MVKPMFMVLVAGLGALLLAGCTTKAAPGASNATQEDAPSSGLAKRESSAPASKQRVTLYVAGMTKVQGIT